MSLAGLVREPDGLADLRQFKPDEQRADEAVGAAFTEAFQSNPTAAAWFATEKYLSEGRMLTQEEATARLQEHGKGFTIPVPQSGIPEDALELLIRRKSEREERQRKIADAPSGMGVGPKMLAAELGASLLDPLNIASAFIPVVPEARYAAMLGKAKGVLGRTGIRAGVGAVEGAAGAIALEPLVMAGMAAEYEDYTMADSLRNIAFGTVMGGGLHASFGAVGDLGKSYTARKLWREIQDQEIASGLETRAVEGASAVPQDGAPKLAFDLSPSASVRTAADLAGFRRASVIELATRELIPEIRAEILADTARVADPGVVANAKAEIASLETRLSELESTESFKARAKELQKAGRSRKEAESQARKLIDGEIADARSRIERARNIIAENKAGAKAQAELSALERGEIPERFRDRIEARAQMAEAMPKPAYLKIEEAAPDAKMAAFKAAIAQAVEGKTIDVEAIIGRDPEGVLNTAKRQLSPESDSLYDPRLNRPEVEVKDDLAEAEAMLKETEDMLGEKLEDTHMETANRYAKAAKALASCIGIT